MSFTSDTNYWAHRQLCDGQPIGREVYRGSVGQPLRYPLRWGCPNAEDEEEASEGGSGGESSTARPKKKKRRLESAGRKPKRQAQLPSTTISKVSVFEVRGDDEGHFAMMRRAIDFFRLFVEQMLNVQEIVFLQLFLLYDICAETGAHRIAGFFSRSPEYKDWCLSCIAVLPQHRSKGFGYFLLNMSYELCLREGRCGTPEPPVSALAKKMCHNVWIDRIVHWIQTNTASGSATSISKISAGTGIALMDVHETLDAIGALRETPSGAPFLSVGSAMMTPHLCQENEKRTGSTSQVYGAVCCDSPSVQKFFEMSLRWWP